MLRSAFSLSTVSCLMVLDRLKTSNIIHTPTTPSLSLNTGLTLTFRFVYWATRHFMDIPGACTIWGDASWVFYLYPHQPLSLVVSLIWDKSAIPFLRPTFLEASWIPHFPLKQIQLICNHVGSNFKNNSRTPLLLSISSANNQLVMVDIYRILPQTIENAFPLLLKHLPK